MLRGIKDLMEPDELVATTDSPSSIDEKGVSCAAFNASDVPPNLDIEKDGCCRSVV